MHIFSNIPRNIPTKGGNSRDPSSLSPDLDARWIWVSLALFSFFELGFGFFFHTEKSKSSFIFWVFSGLMAGWDLLLCFGSSCKGWNVPFAVAAEKIHRVLTKLGRETENNIFPDMKIFSTSAHLCIRSWCFIYKLQSQRKHQNKWVTIFLRCREV